MIETPIDKARTELNEYYSTLLHYPAREGNLGGIEHHLNMTARLARALWNALSLEDGLEDDRDRLALAELASVVSDHASAAEFEFHRKADAPAQRSDP
jgi:hypothetical protein